MNIDELIKETEDKWFKPLSVYNKSLFEKHPLPSHDYTHHYRVWKYCKDILRHVSKNHHHFNRELIEHLIIAVFFHDLGMIYNTGPKHGQASRMLCEEYFETNIPGYLNEKKEILNTIEQHDNKNYNKNKPGEKKLSALNILSLADDMDAYGTIGFFRYLEIYRTRMIPWWKIADKALPNLHQRYNMLTDSFSWPEEFFNTHKQRYQTTCKLFNSLKNGISGKNPNIFLDFLRQFEQYAIHSKKDYQSFIYQMKDSKHSFIKDTIGDFERELKEEVIQ